MCPSRVTLPRWPTWRLQVNTYSVSSWVGTTAWGQLPPVLPLRNWLCTRLFCPWLALSSGLSGHTAVRGTHLPVPAFPFRSCFCSSNRQAPMYLSTFHRDWVRNEPTLGSQGDRKWWLHFQGRGSEEKSKDAPLWPQ